MLLQCMKGNKLSNNEQRVVEYINTNTKQVPELTIADIAKHANVSMSTVTRAIQKCGVNRLKDIRYQVSDEKFISNDVMKNAYMECKKTLQMIDTKELENLVKSICSTEKIHILANGVTGLVGEEFEFRLKSMGFKAVFYRQEVFYGFSRIAKPGELLIIFSVNGANQGLLVAAVKAKKKGMTVATCSCPAKPTVLESISDIMISGSQELIYLNPDDEGYTFSRLGLQVIAQMIIERLQKEVGLL